MRLGFRLVESLYPPNQPLNGGNPIENLTGNLKRKFQFMIVSFDTIIVNRLRVFSKSKIRAKARLYPDRRRGRNCGAKLNIPALLSDLCGLSVSNPRESASRNCGEKSSARPYPRFASTFFS